MSRERSMISSHSWEEAEVVEPVSLLLDAEGISKV